MPSIFDTMSNPNPEIKRILGVLREEGSWGNIMGFRVETSYGIGDVSVDSVVVEISNAFDSLPTIVLTFDGYEFSTQMERDSGESIPDISHDGVVVHSLQHEIYLLERKYRHENVSGVYEVSYVFRYNEKIKRLSGYLQASSTDEAVGTGKSFIAQMYGVNFFHIGCDYAEPFYGDVNWGPMNPLLAIRLTLEPKWNKVIVPKVKAKRDKEND